VLSRNPNYHPDFFPYVPPSAAAGATLSHVGAGLVPARTGRPQGAPLQIQDLAGKRLPFIDTFVFKREAEALPRWQKFLQGYYDSAGVGGDLFNQAIRIDPQGQTILAPALADKQVRLRMQVLPSVFFLGFNMQDPLVGGASSKTQALRHAIGIMLSSEDFNQLFLNGQGIVAQGPIPPGIFGAQSGCEGMDTWRYRCVAGQPARLSLADANAWMVKAGYPHGIDPSTGRALRLRFDTAMGLNPDERVELDWMRQQFAKLGIALDVEATDYARFQEKMLRGRIELFFWGWSADYPDPENFLMLLYSKNSTVTEGGENSSNYSNPNYDRLFLAMRTMPDDAKRRALIAQLVQISQRDAPMLWLFYPRSYLLLQPWVGPTISQGIANNTLKYISLNPSLRVKLQLAWNKPSLWPLITVLGVLFALFFMAWYGYHRRQQRPPGQG